MLEFYFKYPRVLRRLRSGALGEEMDRVAAHLSGIGYKPTSAKVYISRLDQFSQFAARYAQAGPIDQNVIDRFMHSLRAGSPRIAARTAIEHARRAAPERFSAPDVTLDPDGPLLADYLDHLRRVRGLEVKTCEGLLVAARRVLAWRHAHLPDQPLAAMTCEHVLDLTRHLLSLSSNDQNSILDHGAPPNIPALSSVVRRPLPGSCPLRPANALLSTGASRSLPPTIKFAGLDSGKALRPHDLRHRFAVTRPAVWHRENADVQALLPLLATYLGHARYTDTAYYVTATADLLGMAADRAFAGGGVS